MLQIDTAIGWDYLIQQAPVVVVMVLVLYFGFKYFKSKEDSLQSIIAQKDDELKQINRESKDDLNKSYSILQDVNATLTKWLLKDEQNQELKKSLRETLDNVHRTTNEILMKLSK